MSKISRRWTGSAVVVALAFAALNTINALNKGGDADVFFEGGRRFLMRAPLYEDSSAASGFIGPPFQAMFFAPFAAIAAVHPILAKLLWHFLNVGFLFAGGWLAVKTWGVVRDRIGRPPANWLSLAWAPLAALLLPIQTNFEHQNMNALLLLLLAAASWFSIRGSMLAAGALIGSAAALKAFPILLVGYFAARREWRGLAAAIATASVLTVAPAIVYGIDAYGELLKTFAGLADSGWPIRGNNQSLIAAMDRWVNGFAMQGVRDPSQAPGVALGFAALAGVLMATAIGGAVSARGPRGVATVVDMAALTVLAVLLSPIAWDHYWLLLLPAFIVLFDVGNDPASGRGARYAFWAAAILTTGLSPLTLGRSYFGVARALSVSTIAALIVFAALIVLRWFVLVPDEDHHPRSDRT
jgi:alpha-1,2-mannosyltransferase